MERGIEQLEIREGIGVEYLDDLISIELSATPNCWTRLMFEEELRTERGYHLGAYLNQALVGFLLSRIVGDRAQIMNIAIKQDLHRCGIGRSLLQHLVATAAARKLSEITLEVRHTNSVAIAFYRTHGFQQVGIRPKYYDLEVDALLFSRLPGPNDPSGRGV